jgi:FAD/FMN-containing dehydrogenase
MNTSDVSKLRELVRGRVLEPSDAGYEQVRSVFYRGYDRHPAAIVRPRDGADVTAAVTLATATGAELAVRSGGHSIAGHGATEGGIVIDMRDMRAFDIDTDGRTAWAGTGLTAGEYTRAAGAHGLATGFGDTGSVGIGGITLAGGIGLLVRKYGLTIDSLLAAEIVTADGRLLRVDGDNHPDLFWAIRGGGGNFGVATRFRYRLHEVDRVVGGILVLPAAPDVVLGLVALAEEASDDLTTIFNLMKAPPLPFIPPEYHGEPVVACMMIHAGDLDAGERAADRVRKVAPPIVDMVKPIRYPEFFEFGGAPPSVEHEVSHTRFLDEIDKRLVAGLLEQVARSPARLASAQLRVLGGAMARVPEAATAFAHRGRKYLATVGAAYEDGAETSVHEEWIRRVTSLFTPENPGAYSGFLGTDGAARIHEAYPGRTRDRLVEIKRRYDPDNLFRLNHNIDAG